MTRGRRSVFPLLSRLAQAQRACRTVGPPTPSWTAAALRGRKHLAVTSSWNFEAIYPAVLAAAERLSTEPMLRVADLGAAGVNSHGLIRDLVAQRAGRPLIYALVDLPTNAWRVAGAHLRKAFGAAVDQGVMVVIPGPAESGPGFADTGTGAHYISPEAHGEACRRALDCDPPPTTVVSMAGIPASPARTCCWPTGNAGRIGGATVAAAVLPVWSRTLDEFGVPFQSSSGSVAGLELESIELFRLDNPYWHDNPAVFARNYVQSVTAWGGPLLLRAFALEGEGRAAGLLADFLGELEERVAEAPDRYRWDCVEALVICRKACGAL